jgi:ribonuclease HI
MRFKGQTVFVRADESGRMVLDGDGRAEMKYREGDDRSYRPSPQNLVPASDAPAAAAAPAPRPSSSATGSATGFAKPPVPAKSALPARPGKPRSAALGKMPSGDIVHVWTDGACSGNPGPMGIGMVVIAGDKRAEAGEYLGRGTNNIAELTAVRRGIELAETLTTVKARPLRVYTDSSYTIGLLSQGWKAKANQELVAELRQFLRAYPNMQMVKVEGHAGVPENERCDLLARQAIAQNRF